MFHSRRIKTPVAHDFISQTKDLLHLIVSIQMIGNHRRQYLIVQLVLVLVLSGVPSDRESICRRCPWRLD